MKFHLSFQGIGKRIFSTSSELQFNRSQRVSFSHLYLSSLAIFDSVLINLVARVRGSHSRLPIQNKAARGRALIFQERLSSTVVPSFNNYRAEKTRFKACLDKFQKKVLCARSILGLQNLSFFNQRVLRSRWFFCRFSQHQVER